MEPGAMCYMLSKQGYLSDHDGHISFNDTWEHLTTFLTPLREWAD